MKAAKKSRRSATAANRSSPGKRKPALSQQVALSLVMRYENPGQLTAPNQLSVGDDGGLYLTPAAALKTCCFTLPVAKVGLKSIHALHMACPGQKPGRCACLLLARPHFCSMKI